jgi:hypothetical protein
MAELGFLGGLALGGLAVARDSDEDARVSAEFFNSLRQRRQSMAQGDLVDALVDENERLRAHITILEDYINRHEAWADGEIARLKNL